jgi:hypothetical protein
MKEHHIPKQRGPWGHLRYRLGLIGGLLPCLFMPCSQGLAESFSRRHEGARVLRGSDGRLAVEVMDPAVLPPEYIFRKRFSPLGFVTQVELDGRPFVYAALNHAPNEFLGGIPMEFDLWERTSPPGYDDAPPGGPFIKIGIGVLRRDDDFYRHIKDYPVEDKPVVSVEWRPDGATFRQNIESPVQGFACALEVELKIEGNRLTHITRLTNTGEKPLATEQYLHNFFRFSDKDTGPEYLLHVPFEIELCDKDNQPIDEPPHGFVVIDPNTMSFSNDPSQFPSKAFLRAAEGEAREFTLANRTSGQQLRVTSSRPLVNIAIFVTDHQISPEANVLLEIPPGETEVLTRTYEFTNN